MKNQASISNGLSNARYLVFVPSFAVSLAVTELFFKFHSFSLELLGFSMLWAGLYGAQSFITKLASRR